MSGLVSYEGKVAVITGAATGVGAALVEVLRAAGASHIVALDIKPCDGPADQNIRVDLSDPHAIDDAITALPAAVDVLFNNAGVAATLPTDVVMAVNVLAPRRLIAGVRQRIPAGGAVVITASSAGRGYPDRPSDIQTLLAIDDWHEALDWVRAHPALTNNPYGFSKECAQVLTLRLASQLGRLGIRSGGRRASPREVASALAFLGSDAAAYVNGVNLLIDNGFTAAVLTSQADFSTMPAPDHLMNAAEL